MQAFARIGLERGLAARLVVPGPVASARLHRREHVHEPRPVTTSLKHPGNHLFLADVRLSNELDLDAGAARQLLRPGADPLAQRLGEASVIEDADATGLQKARHALGITHPRQSTGDDHAVVARQRPQQAVMVTLGQQLRRHHRLRSSSRAPTYSTLYGSGSAGLGSRGSPATSRARSSLGGPCPRGRWRIRTSSRSMRRAPAMCCS
jgi:hypothetical protein